MKYLIIIPTYNEAENVAQITTAILKYDQKVNILVVDDNSPDKTAKIVVGLPQFGKRVYLLKRKGKLGLGTAYQAGFTWGLEQKYTHLISMDADFSHPPEAIPQMLQLSKKYPNEIILGSRYVKGGQIVGWGASRYFNSYLANFFTRKMLHLKPKDATSGFKCYPAEFIKSIDFAHLTASGYAFQVEMIFDARLTGTKIREFPIIFRDRRAGQSKISGELLKSAQVVFKLFIVQVWVRQFVKFCLVGATCALIDWVIFFLIKHSTGWETQGSKQIIKAISFIFSALSSYLLNRTWTFKSKDKNVLRQAIKFFVVSTIGLALNNLFFFLMTGLLKLSDLLGLMIATFLVLFWNFSANKLWVFRKKII